MSDTTFFPRATVLTIGRVCELAGIAVPPGVAPDEALSGAVAVGDAGPADLVYMDNPRYVDALSLTQARACLASPRFADKIPSSVVALVCPDPYRVFATVLAELYPTSMRPGTVFGMAGIAPGAFVHPAARLEPGVDIDPGAVIGPQAEIGTGTSVAAGAVIGPKVRIGRHCAIGPQASVQAALLGNRVIVHAGVRIGQDGFGFAMGPRGHLKVPQTGRVIIQDDVEIGANTCIDRGASRDTVIGEGTKIDNLVQIGHNVSIGRHCVIVANVGISGSTTLEDFVVIGGAAGTVGHIRVGRGAQIAGASHVTRDVPAGARWGGTPAKPLKEWARELAAVVRLGARKSKTTDGQKGRSDEEGADD